MYLEKATRPIIWNRGSIRHVRFHFPVIDRRPLSRPSISDPASLHKRHLSSLGIDCQSSLPTSSIRSHAASEGRNEGGRHCRVLRGDCNQHNSPNMCKEASNWVIGRDKCQHVSGDVSGRWMSGRARTCGRRRANEQGWIWQGIRIRGRRFFPLLAPHGIGRITPRSIQVGIEIAVLAALRWFSRGAELRERSAEFQLALRKVGIVVYKLSASPSLIS